MTRAILASDVRSDAVPDYVHASGTDVYVVEPVFEDGSIWIVEARLPEDGFEQLCVSASALHEFTWNGEP